MSFDFNALTGVHRGTVKREVRWRGQAPDAAGIGVAFVDFIPRSADIGREARSGLAVVHAAAGAIIRHEGELGCWIAHDLRNQAFDLLGIHLTSR